MQLVKINKVMNLREVILNTRKPIVLHKFSLEWNCFECPLDVWCQKFDDIYLAEQRTAEFDRMPSKFHDSPQWERYRTKIQMTLMDFLEKHSKDSDHWFAFNYKPLANVPRDCRSEVDFSCFGFPDAASDASFWLSSRGANTPCHFDTYGCNIVVQIYGRKHWLLFPPETKLTPTRVPYEESSVYCYENFYSPSDLTKLSEASQNAYDCILEEGDVLIVPRNWWHYVESIEVSLSVNTWIPLKIDLDAQIKECIVKFLVEKSLSGESEECINYVLNPNQLELVTSSAELFDILNLLLEKTSLPERIPADDAKYSYQYLSETELDDMIKKLPYEIDFVKRLCPNDFNKCMETKVERHDITSESDALTVNPMQEALLNAICHPNVIEVMKENLLKTYSRRVAS